MPDKTIEDILDLTPSDGEHEFKTSCPFHKDGNERKPSFFIYLGPSSSNINYGTSYCHTCGRGWSLRGLLRELGIKDYSSYVPDENMIRLDLSSKPDVLNDDILNVKIPEFFLATFDFYPKSLLNKVFTK